MIRIVLMLSMLLLVGCQQPNANPAPKKSSSVTAKFTPENPNFSESGKEQHVDTDGQAEAKAYWNTLEGGESPPVKDSEYRQNLVLPIPFGVTAADFEAQLPRGWKEDTTEAAALYDPTMTAFTERRYVVPGSPNEVTPMGEMQVAAGFLKDQFGDLRIHWKTPSDQHDDLAAELIRAFGPCQLQQEQTTDAAAGLHRKAITLTWKVVDVNQDEGFISYQVIYQGPRVGSSEELLTPVDAFVQASFTTMTPSFMAALKASVSRLPEPST